MAMSHVTTPISTGPGRRQLLKAVSEAVAEARAAVGWSQRELAGRARTSQATVSLVERAKLDDLTFETAEALLEALGVQFRLVTETPLLLDRRRQREPVHARCIGYLRRRLEGDGWSVSTEVEIGSGRARGWIDLLAYHPAARILLVVEVKTELHDIGQVERTLGWYEREAWAAARRLGWRPRAATACLAVLDTDANVERLLANRSVFERSFPLRAAHVGEWLRAPGSTLARGHRIVGMIDPRARRHSWLRPTRLEGRRSPAAFADYADAHRVLERGRAGRGTTPVSAGRGAEPPRAGT